ncbi:MAG: 3-isopropylmalate dehydratase small subunit [Actinomycetota bacterium]|nr:3-isopropylmalate dehydratase small subunit [Actinomycetota bacterium]
MKPFRSLTARAAVLDRADVDTDQIVPKQFLKRIERTGYGDFLFYDWRKDPTFELNRPEAAAARILLAGRNFGCGSSREHAVWALQDYGFEVVIAPSFADIFFSNAMQSGLVAISLPADEVKGLMRAAGDGGELTVDLDRQTITDPDGRSRGFEFDPFLRRCLLDGLDAIARALEHEKAIAAFELARPSPVATTALEGAQP